MLFPGGNNKKKEKFPDSEVQYSRETRDKRKETGERRWQKGDGRQEVGGRKREAGHVVRGNKWDPPTSSNVGNSPHIFVASPDQRVFF